MHYTKLGAPNWAKNSVRYREIFPWDTISPYQSQKIKIRIQYLDISYLVMSHDKGYDITIYRDVSCDITPNHLETPGKYKFNENPPPRCGLLLLFSAVSALILACPPSGLLRRLSIVHQLDTSYDWPYQQTATLSPQDPACSLSAWCLFLFHFSLFFLCLFLSLSISLLDTRYLVLLAVE